MLKKAGETMRFRLLFSIVEFLTNYTCVIEFKRLLYPVENDFLSFVIEDIIKI